VTVDVEFADFVEGRWDHLVRAAVLMGCSLPQAEDVVQDTLVRCWTHWDRVTQASHTDAYVHRVLVNTFNSSRRRRWSGEQPVAAPPETGAGNDFDAVDTADAVLRALRALPRDHRVAVVLRYYLHLPEAQMAEALRVPIGTVKSRLSRSLKALAESDQLRDLRGAP
jgi:RNA polymerase sigma-70 factor (sigma-E family)